MQTYNNALTLITELRVDNLELLLCETKWLNFPTLLNYIDRCILSWNSSNSFVSFTNEAYEVFIILQYNNETNIIIQLNWFKDTLNIM